MLVISVANNELFSFRLNEFDKPAFSKNSTLATVFENLRFCFSNSSSMYGQKAKSERKKLRFQNMCGWDTDLAEEYINIMCLSFHPE